MVIPPEQPLSPQAYAFLANLVYERSRIQLGPDRQALLTGRLGQRLRSLGLAGYEDYCRLLESRQGEEEVGSKNLDPFIESQKDLLKADVVLISDTSMFDRGVPSLC